VPNKSSINPEFSQSDFGSVLSRHSGKAFLTAVAILGLTFAAVTLYPTNYVSSSKLFIDIGRETVSLDPTATTGQTVQVFTPRQDEINSVVELLQSRDILRKVAEEVGATSILNDDSDDLELEEAVETLQENITVSSERDSSVISVEVKAKSAELAQLINKTLIDIYREAHMTFHRTSGSEGFFGEQKDRLRDELTRVQDELLVIRNEAGYASVDGQRTLLEAQKTAIASQLSTAQKNAAVSRARCEALQKTIDSLDENIMYSRIEGMPNAAADGMREKLFELEMSKGQLLEKYPLNHPSVVAITAQVESLRSIHNGEDDARVQATMMTNPNRQALELLLLQEQAELAGYEMEQQALRAQQQPLIAELQELNADSMHILKLQDEADILRETYQNYSRSYELARIDSALAAQNITNVNIAESATLPRKPSGPTKVVIVILGVLSSLFGATAVPLLAESLRYPAIHRTDSLRVPARSEVPYNESQESFA